MRTLDQALWQSSAEHKLPQGGHRDQARSTSRPLAFGRLPMAPARTSSLGCSGHPIAIGE